ncbi:MAG: HIT family protein [Rickettsiales bacterium]|jgi:diadenosine tetraphosphate (Ap4A) HIT family hydrolase|nr:HIT family protein [Rickettsiales bacterium]
MACIFCNLKKEDGILYETDNFYIKVGIGIVTAGHVMLIPKKHIKAMGELDDSLVEEYIRLKNVLVEKIYKIFADPFLIEYGNQGQSVEHAHLHFIPTSGNGYKNINFYNHIEEFAKDTGVKIFKINKFSQLQDYLKENSKYIYYEDADGRYIIQADDKYIPDYRNFFTKLGVKGCENWKEMTEKDKELDKIKIDETKNKLNFG